MEVLNKSMSHEGRPRGPAGGCPVVWASWKVTLAPCEHGCQGGVFKVEASEEVFT